MATTTSYGTWYNHTKSNLNVESDVATYVSGGPCDWLERIESDGSFDAMVAAYRGAVNDSLPAEVSLCGDDFYGPYYEADKDFGGYPLNEYGDLDIAAIIAGVDLGEIVEDHDQVGERA